jgi:hypothetical protein
MATPFSKPCAGRFGLGRKSFVLNNLRGFASLAPKTQFSSRATMAVSDTPSPGVNATRDRRSSVGSLFDVDDCSRVSQWCCSFGTNETLRVDARLGQRDAPD